MPRWRRGRGRGADSDDHDARGRAKITQNLPPSSPPGTEPPAVQANIPGAEEDELESEKHSEKVSR